MIIKTNLISDNCLSSDFDCVGSMHKCHTCRRQISGMCLDDSCMTSEIFCRYCTSPEEGEPNSSSSPNILHDNENTTCIHNAIIQYDLFKSAHDAVGGLFEPFKITFTFGDFVFTNTTLGDYYTKKKRNIQFFNSDYEMCSTLYGYTNHSAYMNKCLKRAYLTWCMICNADGSETGKP